MCYKLLLPGKVLVLEAGEDKDEDPFIKYNKYAPEVGDMDAKYFWVIPCEENPVTDEAGEYIHGRLQGGGWVLR